MILHTTIEGAGHPILFLHTGLQTGDVDFSPQTEYFKHNYQIILPDLRGHGKSVTENFSDYFNKAASDLSETMENLNIEAAHIVGCSLGALVGLTFSKNHPHKVKSLSISGIMPRKPDDYEELNKKEMKNLEKLMQDEETTSYFDRLHKGDWRQLLQVTQNHAWYPFSETSDLSTIDVPVMFIVGEENEHEVIGTTIYPPMNKNIHVAVVPFAGHAVHLDQPEIYNKILKTFLKSIK